MKKVVKKGVKTAIIIYQDPDLKEGRRFIFGDPMRLMSLMLDQFPILWKRVQTLLGKNLSMQEAMTLYEETKEEWTKTHGVGFSEKEMRVSLSYEINKLK